MFDKLNNVQVKDLKITKITIKVVVITSQTMFHSASTYCLLCEFPGGLLDQTDSQLFVNHLEFLVHNLLNHLQNHDPVTLGQLGTRHNTSLLSIRSVHLTRTKIKVNVLMQCEN